MSGKRFQSRAKTVQKLGRDGLVEQNMATGEEKRVSQRTADISFGPARPQEQAAGHRAAQRSGGDSASPGKKRRKQPRPVQQTAEEAAYATPAPTSVPEAPMLDTPSMRMAADAPMMAAPTSSEDPPPPPTSRKRRKRKNRKKSKQRQAARLSPDAARSLEDQPMRAAGDAPMQNRPPGKGRKPPVKRPPRPVEGGGRLQFKAAEGEQPPSDSKAPADGRAKMKKRQAQRFTPDSARPAVSEAQPSRLIPDGGSRLHFEGSEVPAPDAEAPVDEKRAVMKRQVTDHATQPEQSEGGGDTRQRDSPPAGLPSPAPDDRAYQKRQAAKFAAHSAVGKTDRPRLQFEEPPPAADSAPTPAPKEDAPPTSRNYQKAVRRVERAEGQVEQAREHLPTKRRLSFQPEPDGETGRTRRRLHFEQEVLPEYRPPSLPARAGSMAKTAAVMKLHGKIHESERQNVGVEATHKSELFMEQGVGRALRWQRNRRRSKPYRALRQAEQRAAKENVKLAWQTALRDNPELRRKNALAKWIQKQKIKRKYAQAAHEAKQTAHFTQNVVHATGQIVRAVQQYCWLWQCWLWWWCSLPLA